MKTKLPTPDKTYLEIAARRQALLEQGAPKSRIEWHKWGDELKELEQLLRDKFQKAFGLSRDRLKLAKRFYWRFCNTELKPEQMIFDHKDFFQRGRNLVIVSQPYGIDTAELARWSNMAGASIVVAKEWGYYYPGHASLFFVEFTPQAKMAFDKRLRKL